MTVRVMVGDALSVLGTLPAESVQLCVTSPPYTCGPTCIRIRALIHEACDILEAETGERPVQLDMFRRAAG